MLADVGTALREEERLAWQSPIRVLGHEINNSLAPIKSIAGSLRSRLSGTATPLEFERRLAVIEDPAEALNRFLQAYQRLSRLPAPNLQPTTLSLLLFGVVPMEIRPMPEDPKPLKVSAATEGVLKELATLGTLPADEWRMHMGDLAHGEAPELDIRNGRRSRGRPLNDQRHVVSAHDRCASDAARL